MRFNRLIINVFNIVFCEIPFFICVKHL